VSNYQKINQQYKGKDIISLQQFDTSSISQLFETTKHIITQLNTNTIVPYLQNKLATLLFFEPSSRTISSFSASIKRLGGVTIEYQNPLETSSAVKGETFEDSIKVFETYSDIIIIRHFENGSALRASNVADIPVVNAGDGYGEHPTQALLDMYTIHQRFNTLENLTGLIAGDLLYGRTVHSLLRGLSFYKGNTIYLLSPKRLMLPEKDVKEYTKLGLKLIQIHDEEDIPKNCQFWYWTRVQKERFAIQEEYEKIKHSFIITPNLLKNQGNKNMIILHPLPRVGEIDPRIDSDPRAWYLSKQMKNGMYIRMALLSLITGAL